MKPQIQDKIDNWLNGSYDNESKNTIRAMSFEEQADSFYKNLEFGTGGLRGLMGVGTNRMNKYTVGMATQGYANYLLKVFGEKASVVIGHDCRNNSRYFAEITANVFAANGIKVYLFEALRPTPEISFAIRKLGCKGGVVCTASHNPKEYNGYKAYWDDGAQMIPPHDGNVIVEVEKINSINDVKWNGNKELITVLGKDMDDQYIEMVKTLSINPDIVIAQKDLSIVYTPIHGTGITLMPQVLKAFGFENVTIVDTQSEPDGNFSTVVYPNPEEKEAMSHAVEKAKEINAEILLGTDPDADRVGVGIKNNKGEWELMNGNQTAVLAFNYIMEARVKKGIAQANDMVIKTIVTTDLIDNLAKAYKVNCYNVLTGFKWISKLIAEKEANENYVVGGEESFGLMIGDKVRDKDAISAVALLCEMAAYEKHQGKTLFDKLIDLYVKHGFYFEDLISITKKGMNGAQEIAEMMTKFREKPPLKLAGIDVAQILDYDNSQGKNIIDNTTFSIDLPKSNVLQFILTDGSKVSARPSGTEPKIKFYFSVKEQLAQAADYDKTKAVLVEKIKLIRKDLSL